MPWFGLAGRLSKYIVTAAEALHSVGIQNVVMWESGRSVPMLPALHFNHAFLSTLAFPHAGYNEVGRH